MSNKDIFGIYHDDSIELGSAWITWKDKEHEGMTKEIDNIVELKDRIAELEFENHQLNQIMNSCPGCMAAEQGIESLVDERDDLICRVSFLEQKIGRMQAIIYAWAIDGHAKWCNKSLGFTYKCTCGRENLRGQTK